MKSRIYKSLLVIMLIAMVIDWPVSADAINGKAIRNTKGIIKSCQYEQLFKKMNAEQSQTILNKISSKTEQNVNKMTQEAKTTNPVIVDKAAQSATNAVQNKKQSSVCTKCNGSGQISFGGEYYICPVCNGSGNSFGSTRNSVGKVK